jgi:tetratricopeptide (TPR) repeat protein
MKYGPRIFLIALILAFIGIAVAFRPRAAKRLVPEIETVIGCAPSAANLVTDENGKFINPLPGLGKHRYTVSTRNDSTQFYFNQGINFYYSYHLREALASFKEAARFDSSSAMTYWGQALAMGPYYNVYTYKMKPGVAVPLASMTRHRENATPKEQDLIDAMQKRYSGDTTNADRAQLDKAYAEALFPLTKKYPADNDIKALYIDAVMLEHKWDFYTPDRDPKPWTPELVALCETILQADPHHPAALHYYIHLTEASANPSMALAGADVLKDEMPGVSHMVHMATHMYQRNGLFSKGVTVNEDANTASNTEDSLAPMLGLGRNDIVHIFAVQSYCAMTAGMYRKGLPIYARVREKILAGKPNFEQDAYAQWIYMLPTIALVRLGKWEEILQADPPQRRWKYAQLIDQFARGMADVRLNKLPAAKAESDSLGMDLGDGLLQVRLMPFNKPADCGSIASGILQGEIDFADGRHDSAVAVFKRAVAAEDGLIYREPQQWLLPARQYLGKYLLKMNRAPEAEQVYRQDLDLNPGDGWSLLGLYQSLAAQRKTAEAEVVKTKYLQAFAFADVNPGASAF